MTQMKHLDMKRPFLHCELKEVINMEKTSDSKTQKEKVLCENYKSIYGFKQATTARSTKTKQNTPQRNHSNQGQSISIHKGTE